MNKAAVHRVHRVGSTHVDYKATYLAPYSSFLNLVEWFWSKFKDGIKKDYQTVVDNLTDRMI